MLAKIGRRRVATGANHPASHSSAFRRGPGTPAGAPTGDQSTGMHVTPKPPLVRQDRITRDRVAVLFFLTAAQAVRTGSGSTQPAGPLSRPPGGEAPPP